MSLSVLYSTELICQTRVQREISICADCARLSPLVSCVVCGRRPLLQLRLALLTSTPQHAHVWAAARVGGRDRGRTSRPARGV